MERIREIKGYFNSKLFGKPFFAMYRMTRACNLRCRMCNVWQRKDIQSEMSLDQVRQTAAILRRLSIPYIVLTGGDPFLKKDIIEIIRIFADAGFHTRIETNGGSHVTNEILDKAVAAGIYDFSTSLDTLDKAKQDFLCKGKNVWDNAVSTLKYAMKVFPGILPHVNIVVSHHNLSELPELVRFIHDLGAYCTLAPVVLGTEGDNALFKGFDTSFRFTGEDDQIAKEVYDEVIRLKTKKKLNILNSSRFLRESVDFIRTGDIKWECDGGRLYLEVFPDGEIGLCNEVSLGYNVLDGDFVGKFKSKEYLENIKRLRAGCHGCTYPIFREPTYHLRYYSVLGEMMRRYLRELGKWD